MKRISQILINKGAFRALFITIPLCAAMLASCTSSNTQERRQDSLNRRTSEINRETIAAANSFSIFLDPAVQSSASASATQASSGSNTTAIRKGLGIYTTVSASADADDEREGRAQVDTAIAAITLDANGIITNISFDAAQTRVLFNNKGEIISDLFAPIETKLERGDAYGMRRASAIEKEWNEQAKDLEFWSLGKTPAEVTSMPVKEVNSYPNIPDVPDLAASVTINVGDLLLAVDKAVANAAPAFVEGRYRSGLGVVTDIGMSRSAEDDRDGVGQVTSNIAAVTIDDNGVIVSLSIDSAHTPVRFNVNGEITTELNFIGQTKIEQGDEYGMRRASPIEREWDEQIHDFIVWCIGKTADEIAGMPVKTVNNYDNIPDVPELLASVTMDVGNYVQAIQKAVANAR